MHDGSDITHIADLQIIEPAIFYFGTPVVLIGSSNEDGSFNLAPMSSAWWVGWRCMLGLASNSKTTENMICTGECVLNLPSADLVDAVNRLARTTGSSPGTRQARSNVATGTRRKVRDQRPDAAAGSDGRLRRAPRNARCRSRQRSRMSTRWRRKTKSGAAVLRRSRFASPACTRIRKS